MSCSLPDKVHVQNNVKRCTICDNYTRKIEEVELILSGRDAIIDALQYQIKKYEKNYKTLFNDFEDLRLRYLWVSQDNSCLKQINAKLEELAAVKKQINQKIINCNDMSLRKESVVNPDTNQRSMEPEEQQSLPILQEVSNIEVLVNKQNAILQEVLNKISDELNANQRSNNSIVQSTQCTIQESESGDYLNTTLTKLQEEIKRLNCIVDELQQENERLKQNLSNKKKNVSTKSTLCTNFSTNISPKIDSLNVDDTAKEIVRLQKEIQVKEKHFEACTCQLMEQLNDMHDNNQCLSDTLTVMTAENKNNLAIISNLKDELNRVNQDHDERIATMKCRINCLENELEESKSTAKKLKQLIEAWEKETQTVKDRLKHVVEKNKNIKQCQCDAEKEFTVKLAELETENAQIRKELTEKALELTEYEEENRHFCQKLDILANYNAKLLTKVKELQEPQQNETFEQSTQMSTTNIQPNASKLRLEKQGLEDKCRGHQKELEETKLQLNNLRSSIKTQLEELDTLGCENDCLKKEMEQVRRDSKSESEKLQSLVNHNQNQVEMLLKEHDEKTSQIENIANELDSIRKSVTKDTESFLLRIRMLENERDELKEKLKELKDCNCKETAAELERLKAELIRKQCIILELEKSVDSFNETLKNFDRTAEELACENACLKNDRDLRLKDLETIQLKLAEKTKELDRTRKQLENLENLSKTGNITKKSLEAESKLLKGQCECLFKTIKKLELDNEMLQKEVEKFQAERGKMEKALMKNCELQMELDSLKQNHSRRESTTSRKLDNLQNAYDELKNLYDKTNQENSKLKEDIKTCYESGDATKCTCVSLQRENEKLLKNTHMMREEVDSLNCECDKLKKDLTKKRIEIECLTETADQQKKEKQLCQKDCHFLKQKQECMEKELNDTKEKLRDLRKEYDQKSQDLKKIKKQWECCAKKSQITREEYNNLRKEYKDIKSMLSDQIKRYKLDTGSVEPGQSCDVVNDLKRQILDKENQIMTLQQKLKDASYEIIEMKDYIHKLIGDNNNLKSGINNLIGNLERKIKGPSFGSLSSNSAEAIAGEILTSLTEIEDVIMKNSDGCQSSECPRGCKKPCDCMSEITSQYSFKEPQQDPSNCLIKCRNMMESLSKCVSEPISKFASEPNTSDSEDPNSVTCVCMDKESLDLEFFKEAVQDLKTRIDCTMKEKCCDCEEFSGCKEKQ